MSQSWRPEPTSARRLVSEAVLFLKWEFSRNSPSVKPSAGKQWSTCWWPHDAVRDALRGQAPKTCRFTLHCLVSSDTLCWANDKLHGERPAGLKGPPPRSSCFQVFCTLCAPTPLPLFALTASVCVCVHCCVHLSQCELRSASTPTFLTLQIQHLCVSVG